jgi:hypothetical protein
MKVIKEMRSWSMRVCQVKKKRRISKQGTKRMTERMTMMKKMILNVKLRDIFLSSRKYNSLIKLSNTLKIKRRNVLLK